MVKSLDQILIEQRSQGQRLLPLILRYCDGYTRIVFDTCCALESKKTAAQLCLESLCEVNPAKMNQSSLPITDERGLEVLRAVLVNLADLRGAAYRSWLVGVIDRVQEWD